MKKPQLKAFVFFFGMLGVGYALAFPFLTGMVQAPLNLVAFLNMTAFAFLLAVLATVWLDKPLDLELFNWPEKKPEEQRQEIVEVPVQPAEPQVVAETEAEPDQLPPGTPVPGFIPGGLFPHELPTDHWDADYGDSKQVYEGTALPIWILAGWAVFILWAVIYLISGLPNAF